MTTFLHPKGKTWRYDFRWKPPGATKSTRYQGSTGQLTKNDADRVEAQIKERVRQDAYGIAPLDRMATPSFTAWAAQHLARIKKRKKLERPEALEQTLRLALQFWGRRPPSRKPGEPPHQWAHMVEAADARAAAAPYHDLRLADPILEPMWLERFEDWMDGLGLSGSRKNQYRSTMSGIYRTALLPQFRQVTRVTANPFQHLERDVTQGRDTLVTLEQLRAWMAAAAPHLRVAMAIAAYAPELRRGVILNLQWREHLDQDLTRIVVRRHKASKRTGRAQIVPIDPSLAAILRWWRTEHPRAVYVIEYEGGPVTRPETGFRNAARRANARLPAAGAIRYGARTGGVTFHTIRHTMATLLAELGVPEKIRQMVMDHRALETTQRYTHLAGAEKKRPLQRLSARLQLVETVQGRVQERPSGSRRNAQRKTKRDRGVGASSRARKS